MSHKTIQDIERVIALGKPQRVIDKFIESYRSSLGEDDHDETVGLVEKIETAQRKKQKLKGVEFEGVMCSTTKDDQHGIGDVLYLIDHYGYEPNFKFSNGNKLKLTKDNIQQFMAVWLPEREKMVD